MKQCVLCENNFEPVKNGHTRKYCFDCVPLFEKGNKETQNYAMKKKHLSIKKHLVNYKGGKCEKCGYDKCFDALHFHHNNPAEKDFGISLTFRELSEYYKEVDKCSLLCANCHSEIHFELKQLEQY